MRSVLDINRKSSNETYGRVGLPDWELALFVLQDAHDRKAVLEDRE